MIIWLNIQGKSTVLPPYRNNLSPKLAAVRSTVLGDAASSHDASWQTWKANFVSIPVWSRLKILFPSWWESTFTIRVQVAVGWPGTSAPRGEDICCPNECLHKLLLEEEGTKHAPLTSSSSLYFVGGIDKMAPPWKQLWIALLCNYTWDLKYNCLS